MISVYKIKPAFQKLLRPLLQGLHRLGVTANQLTILAILLSAGLGVLLLFSDQYPYFLLLVALGLLSRMALNALDGMMATQFDMKSRLGEILNEIGDVISDSLIIFALTAIAGTNPMIIVLFATLSIINEFAGLLGKAAGEARRYDGPMGKSDRALLIGVYCIGLFFWDELRFYSDWVFGAAGFLVIISTGIRIKKTL